MKLLSHGPEPCASANSAIPARHLFIIWVPTRKSKYFFEIFKIFLTGFYSITLTRTTPSIAFNAAIRVSDGFLLTSKTVYAQSPLPRLFMCSML